MTYHSTPPVRGVGRQVEGSIGLDPALVFRLALGRTRKMLAGFVPGMAVDSVRLARVLTPEQDDLSLEPERLFALGWLAWLDGQFNQARDWLCQASERGKQAMTPPSHPDLPSLEPGILAGRIAYWLGRLRLLLGEPAIADYEVALRKLGGLPRSTAYYVDLLWRSGKIDRAEQVFKSLRTNKRLMACDEAMLLDARLLLRRGELGPAEKLLRDMTFSCGVCWVERELLLAWTLAGMRRPEQAYEALERARRGPFPARSLEVWKQFVAGRLEGELPAIPTKSAGWHDFLAAQELRSRGEHQAAVSLYQQASAIPAVSPFAQYGLACLHEGDPALVLAGSPGAYFALRARVRIAVEKFRRREIGPMDFLEQTAALGDLDDSVGHFRRLARGAVPEAELPGPARNNAIELILEQRLRRDNLTTVASDLERLKALVSDAQQGDLARQQVRLALLAKNPDFLPPQVGDLTLLAGTLLDSSRLSELPDHLIHPAALLLRGAQGKTQVEVSLPAYRGLAQVLALVHAARQGDLGGVVRSLEDLDAWRLFHPGPPRSVLRILESLVASRPGFPGWRILTSWLPIWNIAELGSTLATLAGYRGCGGPMSVPSGMAPGPWLLHQATRALLRDDPITALALVRQSLDHNEEEVARAAIPCLVKLADAATLLLCLGLEQIRPARLVPFIESIEGSPCLEAIRRKDAGEVRIELARLLHASKVAGTVNADTLHALALITTHDARRLESRDMVAACAAWRLAWDCWVQFFRQRPEGRALLVEHLLEGHRQRLMTWIADDAMEPARLLAELLRSLPTLDESLSAPIEQFRNELVSEGLTQSREAMRHGEIPEGWRSDYERGLAHLTRVVSLERENLRLLAAVIEICNEWFLDLYNTHAQDRLRDVIDHQTPLAVQLARLIHSRPAEIGARSALAEFYKFRGFVERDPATRITLYREALRFHPGNENVRELLRELGVAETPGGEEA